MTDGEGRLVAERYQLFRSLGRGGMGEVWQAWDTYLERDVAIKELYIPGAPSEKDPAVLRALREARAAARLKHPGIITVHDVANEDGRPWIVMELIEGRSLAEVLRDDGPQPEHRAARIGLQVLHALEFAHRRGIVHRDVKPGNIMLDQHDRVVLTDFSIAVIDGATALTAPDQLIGSLEYIAPERIGGSDATGAADLWALGVTLYSTLTGRSPFQSTDHRTTLAGILTRDPEPIPNCRLWTVIDGLLRKDPAERLTSDTAAAWLANAIGVPATPALTVAGATGPPPETRIQDPVGQITVTPETLPKTRTAPPPLPARPDEEPTVTPHEPTALAVPIPRQRRGGRIAVVIGVVLGLVATTIAVVWASSRSPGNGGAASSSRATPSTTNAQALQLRETQETALGFSIGVPADFKRTASEDGDVRDVLWQAPQRDPKISTLAVQVQRDAKTVYSASTYLEYEEQTAKATRDNTRYQRIRLDSDQGGTRSVLEFSYQHSLTDRWFRQLSYAYVTNKKIMYVLTFSMNTSDFPTLQQQWEAMVPTMTAIEDSLHFAV